MSLSTSDLTPKKSNPWAKIDAAPIETCSFESVMSEQLAEHLNLKEMSDLSDVVVVNENDISGKDKQTETTSKLTGDPAIDNDYMLAQLLQHEYDKEFDEMLKANEKVRNRESRVQISYDKYKLVHPVDVEKESEIAASNHVDLPSESESEDGKAYLN